MALTGLIYNTSKENDREQWRRSLAEAGLTLVDGSFEEGATVNNNTDAVWYIAGGQCYMWEGALPKVIPERSTPASTGGVAEGAWRPVGDITLRSELASADVGVGDALIAVRQPFTNSVAMTQHAKNQQTINVADFGATGDGTTDDTDALQNAISYCEGLGTPVSLLFAPGGVYATSAGLGITGSYLTIDCQGASFVRHSSNPGNTTFFTVAGSNCKILNGKFDGGTLSGPSIMVLGSLNTIANNYVTGGASLSAGILLDGNSTTCTNNIISNNVVQDVSGVGISQSNVKSSLIQGNELLACGQEGITIDNASDLCIVIGNRIDYCVVTGGVGGIGIDLANHGLISGNYIINTQSGVPGIKTQNNLGSSYYLTITGNVIQGGTSYGIHLANNGSYITTDCVVSGNIISDMTDVGIRIDSGCTNNVVSGNRSSAGYSDDGYTSTIQSGAEGVCFSARNGSSLSGATGSGTEYTLTGLAKMYDKGANFDGRTFTAPRSGVYNFTFTLRGTSASAKAGALRIVSSGIVVESPAQPVSGVMGGSVSTDIILQEGDTVTFVLYASGGSADVEVASGAAVVSGKLVG